MSGPDRGPHEIASWDDGADDSTAVIMCRRTDRLDQPEAHSTKLDGDCGHELWVAPSSILHAHQLEADGMAVKYQCLPCGMGAARLSGALDINAEETKTLLEQMGAALTTEEIADIKEALNG